MLTANGDVTSCEYYSSNYGVLKGRCEGIVILLFVGVEAGESTILRTHSEGSCILGAASLGLSPSGDRENP